MKRSKKINLIIILILSIIVIYTHSMPFNIPTFAINCIFSFIIGWNLVNLLYK